MPAHVANKILESGTETVRCDLTLEDMLGDYEYDDPTEEEKILMDRIADHVGNDNSDMAIKHAAGECLSYSHHDSSNYLISSTCLCLSYSPTQNT